MRQPAPVVAIVGIVVLTLTACAGTPASDPVAAPPTKIPFTMQAPVTSSTDTRGISVLDHIVLDDAGVYLCVLRRGDDLATLRGRFNPRP